MVTIEKRSCPFCQKTLNIPATTREFKCIYCGKNLVKIDKPSLKRVFETKDEIDFEITKKTMFNFGMQTNTDGLIFKIGSKEKNDFTGYMLELTQSLLKANSHRRKYVKLEKTEIDKIITENKEESGSYIGGANPIELNTEFDGFLIHIKAALDSLAKTTKPLFGFNFKNWGKDKDISGGKILNSLKRNLGQNTNESREMLVKLVEDNLEWLTFIISLRDKPVHKGKTSASDLIYNYNAKTVTPQMLHYSNDKSELLKDFMERIIREIVEFIHNFLFLSFNSKLPEDIKFGFDKNGDACWFPNIPVELR